MPLLLVNATIFFHGYNISADLNEVMLEYSAESLENTVFGNTSRVKRGGLKVSRATGRGFWQAGSNAVDPALFAEVGVDDRVLTIFPVAPIEGSTSTGFGFAFKVTEMQYALGAKVGDMLPFNFVAEGRGIGP